MSISGGKHYKYTPLRVPVQVPVVGISIEVQQELQQLLPNQLPNVTQMFDAIPNIVVSAEIAVSQPNGTVTRGIIWRYPSEEKYLSLDQFNYKLDADTKLFVPVDSLPPTPATAPSLSLTTAAPLANSSQYYNVKFPGVNGGAKSYALYAKNKQKYQQLLSEKNTQSQLPIKGGKHRRIFIPVPQLVPVVGMPLEMQQELQYLLPNQNSSIRQLFDRIPDEIFQNGINIPLPDGAIVPAIIWKFPSKEKYLFLDSQYYKLDPNTELFVPIDFLPPVPMHTVYQQFPPPGPPLVPQPVPSLGLPPGPSPVPLSVSPPVPPPGLLGLPPVPQPEPPPVPPPGPSPVPLSVSPPVPSLGLPPGPSPVPLSVSPPVSPPVPPPVPPPAQPPAQPPVPSLGLPLGLPPGPPPVPSLGLPLGLPPGPQPVPQPGPQPGSLNPSLLWVQFLQPLEPSQGQQQSVIASDDAVVVASDNENNEHILGDPLTPSYTPPLPNNFNIQYSAAQNAEKEEFNENDPYGGDFQEQPVDTDFWEQLVDTDWKDPNANYLGGKYNYKQLYNKNKAKYLKLVSH